MVRVRAARSAAVHVPVVAVWTAARRRRVGMLDVAARDREERDQAEDHGRQRERDGSVAEPKTTHALGLAQPVGERRAERPGGYVGEPEAEDRVPAKAEIADRGNRDHCREQQCRDEVPEPERRRGEVADGRPHRERRHDRRPVEQLAARRVDGVDRQRPLDPVPADEHRRQHDGVEQARGDVGDAEADVQDVGGHRAEHAHADHGEPVGPGDIATHPELQRERGNEPDEPEHDGDLGIHRVDQIVRGRFAHRGREGLDRPEVRRDFRDPKGAADREAADQHAIHHGLQTRRVGQKARR